MTFFSFLCFHDLGVGVFGWGLGVGVLGSGVWDWGSVLFLGTWTGLPGARMSNWLLITEFLKEDSPFFLTQPLPGL